MSQTNLLNSFEQLSIRYKDGHLQVLDQTKLPDVEDWLAADEVEQMWQHIKNLSVRGAPLIGVAAAMSLAVKSLQDSASFDQVINAAEYLKTARPTAVNLMHCCDRIILKLKQQKEQSNDPNITCAQITCKLAEEILQKEIDMNDAMAKYGASLVQQGEGILTHCNTGSLATPGKGTALGVIREAHAQGKNIHVYVDETRPLLQGGRLTAYELQRANIPYTLICDNMAATLMRQGKIQRVFVGADRIATNGDFANKIGTYSVAVLAKHHNIPFHAVAPVSTVDPHCSSGDGIPIEERHKDEVLGAIGHFGTIRWAPKESATYNPAFDVTPGELVTAFVLDTGVYDHQQVNNGALKQLQHYVTSEN